MIVITGSAGFIGSCVLEKFNAEGITDIMLVDDFEREDKQPNYLNKTFSIKINRAEFINWFRQDASMVQYVIHMGARTDTTEFNTKIFNELNLNYTKSLWEICAQNNIPFIYASSAATYGLGEHGYDDSTDPSVLKPLNPYGESKNDFDKWALAQKKSPPKWYGLKFFNVYGPNEYHKARMASVIFHAFNQINANGKVKLFRSHNPDYKDGEQLRDFVYVKDVCDVIWFLYSGKAANGIYNLGSGKARTFNDLVKATFHALNKPVNIEYIDTPPDIRDKYQYFTEAKMNKLLSQGYSRKFHTLEEGVADYVKNYLVPKRFL
jgi:ADP-L-glycero-D-manno-heptose 6-epimerase